MSEFTGQTNVCHLMNTGIEAEGRAPCIQNTLVLNTIRPVALQPGFPRLLIHDNLCFNKVLMMYTISVCTGNYSLKSEKRVI